jgi:CRISPR-associated endonuclease/helicase Cas3
MLDDSKPDPDAPDDPKVIDVADELGRFRAVCAIDEGGWTEPLNRALPDDLSRFAHYAVDLPSGGDVNRRLESYIPKRERREFGTREQRLWRHVGLVRWQARRVSDDLGLAGSDPVRGALELAAAWHDHGKNREIWQVAAGRKLGGPVLGKSGGRMGHARGGYRHEFGSVREFLDGRKQGISDDVFDLAMHIVAAHHGRARPHFPKGGFDPCARARSPEIAAEVVRRFARLQRRYGYWRLAWLENLLRCADARASAEDGAK